MIDFPTDASLIEASLYIDSINKESEREYASDFLNYLLGNRQEPTTKRKQNQAGLGHIRKQLRSVLEIP